MILYSLKCGQDHVFDEWFSNSADYDAKHADGALTCPECGDTHVTKAIMAPRVAKAAAPAAACGAPACSAGACPFAA